MALKQLQNFFKTTISTAWTTGTGNRYIATLPTASTGRLVINPANSTKREIIEYSAKGTDGGGNYITVSVRGVGGTTDQTHDIGEAVRSNITAEVITDIQNELDLKTPLTYLDTDGTLAANSDTKIASQKATKTYADTKLPSSYLDTDVTLAANSDIKVASQKATKTYIDGIAVAGAPNASTTVKGIVEEATQSQFAASTDTGETGARLFAVPSVIQTAINLARPTATTMIPPSSLGNTGVTDIGTSGNTQMTFGMIDVAESMTIASVSIYVNSYTASGTVKLALFSQDGATKHFEITTATISAGSQRVKTALGTPFAITPGKYYIAALITGTGNFGIFTIDPGANAFNAHNLASGEPYYTGRKTVTADTIPSTIDPLTVGTSDQYGTRFVRFDN